MWWSAEDTAHYHAAAEKLETQLNSDCPLADLCMNGKQVLSESIADIAGLLTAHDAYVLSLKGKTDTVIGGLSGEQRFFLAFAQRWRRVQSETALRKQVETDTHPPGEYRSDAVRNVDDWYKAYGIAPIDVSQDTAGPMERTVEVMAKIQKIAMETPGVAHTIGWRGRSFVLHTVGSNLGTMFITGPYASLSAAPPPISTAHSSVATGLTTGRSSASMASRKVLASSDSLVPTA
jgi:hypothetical protein